MFFVDKFYQDVIQLVNSDLIEQLKQVPFLFSIKSEEWTLVRACDVYVIDTEVYMQFRHTSHNLHVQLYAGVFAHTYAYDKGVCTCMFCCSHSRAVYVWTLVRACDVYVIDTEVFT